MDGIKIPLDLRSELGNFSFVVHRLVVSIQDRSFNAPDMKQHIAVDCQIMPDARVDLLELTFAPGRMSC